MTIRPDIVIYICCKKVTVCGEIFIFEYLSGYGHKQNTVPGVHFDAGRVLLSNKTSTSTLINIIVLWPSSSWSSSWLCCWWRERDTTGNPRRGVLSASRRSARGVCDKQLNIKMTPRIWTRRERVHFDFFQGKKNSRTIRLFWSFFGERGDCGRPHMTDMNSC